MQCGNGLLARDGKLRGDVQLSDIHFIVKSHFGISAAWVFLLLFFYTIFKLKGKHIQLHLQKPCSSVNIKSIEIKVIQLEHTSKICNNKTDMSKKKRKKGSILSVALFLNQ